MKILAIIILFASVAFGQTRGLELPRIAGRVYASAFAGMSARTTTPVSAPGLATVQVTPPSTTIVGDTPIAMEATGVPVMVLDGQASETIRPQSVVCDALHCTLTAIFAHAHPGGFELSSVDGGLEEAIRDAAIEGGTVVLDPGWTGTTDEIVNADGTAAVAILDERSGGGTWYRWSGSQYIPEEVDAAQEGAVSSTTTVTGTTIANSNTLTLSSPGDFANGQMLLVGGAGAGNTLATPTAPEVTLHGSTPAAVCTYAIAALDANLGETAASAATSAQDCGNTGANTDDVISTYNLLSWTPVTGAHGYVIYENTGSGYAVAAVTGLSASTPWWTLSTAYALGALIQPRGPQFNGWTYEATAAGTSGTSQPDWCTTAGCTVTDGSVVWTAQPFTWHDDGRNWAWFGVRPEIPTVPALPPAAPINDVLVTKVTSGAGTINLRLADASSASLTNVFVAHDNTAALNAALAGQATGCQIYEPVAGSTYTGTCPTIVIPSGHYMISGPLVDASPYASIRGASGSVIEQINPVADIFDLASPSAGTQTGYLNQIAGLTLIGGWNQVFDGNSIGADAMQVLLTNDEFRMAHDFAFVAFDTVDPGDLHLSSEITISHSRFQDNAKLVYEDGDRFHLDADWMEFLGWTQSNNWGQAQIVNAENGGYLYVTHSEGIPGFGTPGGTAGGRPAGSRWIDDYWDVALRGDRFSAEGGGGMPVVYYQGGFPDSTGTGGAVAFGDGWYYGGQSNANGGATDGSALYLANGSPTIVSFAGNGQIGEDEPYIENGQGNALLYGLWQSTKITAGAANGSLYNPLGMLSISLEGRYGCTQANPVSFGTANFPSALLGAIVQEQCRVSSAVPTSGIWSQGQWVRNYAVSSTAPPAWAVQRSGVASAPWGANTAFPADSFASATPDDGHVFVTTQACTSGSSQPSWNTSTGGTTPDGTCTWTEDGESASFAPLGMNPLTGTCSMSGSTVCSITLAHAYTTPVCLVSQQGTAAVVAAECAVSGSTVTVTAAGANSATWSVLIYGNPD